MSGGTFVLGIHEEALVVSLESLIELKTKILVPVQQLIHGVAIMRRLVRLLSYIPPQHP